VFQNQCSSCHSAEAGKQGFGPSLAGVIGRQSGTLSGYNNYTPAMANAHLVWDAKTLDEFLTSSTQKVPGTSMPVSVPDATARANVIAYLGTLGQAAAPATPPASTASVLSISTRSPRATHRSCARSASIAPTVPIPHRPIRSSTTA